MTRRHLKRLAAPRSWKIERKAHPWAVRPKPGGHRLDDSIPLLYVIRDILGYAQNYREAKRILKEGKIMVDGRVVKDPKRAVGLFDVLEIPITKERYIVVVDKRGSLALEPVKATESKFKLLKLVGKTIVKGGRVQLNFHDGSNMLLDPEMAGKHRVNDSVVLNLKGKALKQHLKAEVGAQAYVKSGAHRSEVATIKNIAKIRSPMPNIVTLEKNGREFRTIEDYIVVVGKDKPVLSVMK